MQVNLTGLCDFGSAQGGGLIQHMMKMAYKRWVFQAVMLLTECPPKKIQLASVLVEKANESEMKFSLVVTAHIHHIVHTGIKMAPALSLIVCHQWVRFLS